MAGGMLTKQAVLLTARYLNTVNDAVSGGQIFALPSGVQSPPYSQTLPGDRIVLDDISAMGLSDYTNTGTLYGGVYEYVQTYALSAATINRGQIAFWLISALPPNTSTAPQTSMSYQVTADAQPSSALPAYIAGVFINGNASPAVPLVKGNYGWIQVAGVASVNFDSTITSTALATTVSAKASASIAGTADAGVALSTVTLANVLGVAIGTPVISTISSVIITRGGTFCGRI